MQDRPCPESGRSSIGTGGCHGLGPTAGPHERETVFIFFFYCTRGTEAKKIPGVTMRRAWSIAIKGSRSRRGPYGCYAAPCSSPGRRADADDYRHGTSRPATSSSYLPDAKIVRIDAIGVANVAVADVAVERIAPAAAGQIAGFLAIPEDSSRAREGRSPCRRP